MRRRSARLQVFAGVAFFDGCDRRLLADLAPHADRLRVRDGQVLATAGRHAWQLLVLVTGTARSEAGGKTRMLGAGDAIAPEAVAQVLPHPATVTAIGDVEVLVVNGPAFSWAARRHPALARPAGGTVETEPTIDLTEPGQVRPAPVPVRRRDARRAARRVADHAGAVHGRNTNLIAGVGR